MAGNDSNVLALLHNDTSSFLDDAVGGGNTTSAIGDAALNTTDKMFGAGSCETTTTGYVIVGDEFDNEVPADQMTLDAWFYVDTLGSFQVIAGKFRDGDGSYMLRLTSGNKLQGTVDIGGGWTVESTTTIVAATWYHGCLTYDGTTIRLHLDGTQEDTFAQTGNVSDSDVPFTINARYDSSSLPIQIFDGKTDEVRFSDVCQTLNPLDPLYEAGGAGTGFTPPTAAYSEIVRAEYSHTDPFIDGATATEYSHTDPFIDGETTKSEYIHADIEYRGDGIMEYFFDLRNSAGVQVDTATGTPPTTVFTDIVQAPSPGDYTLYVRSVQTFKNMSDVVSETFYPFTMGVGGIELPFPNEVLSLSASKRPAGAILLNWSYNANNEAIAPTSFEVSLDAVFNQSVLYTVAGNYSVTIPALPETSTVFKVTAKTGTQETTGLSVTETPDSTAPLDNPFTFEAI